MNIYQVHVGNHYQTTADINTIIITVITTANYDQDLDYVAAIYYKHELGFVRS